MWSPASAEWWTGIGIGGAFTGDPSVEVDGEDLGTADDFGRNSFAFDLRGGYWFEGIPGLPATRKMNLDFGLGAGYTRFTPTYSAVSFDDDGDSKKVDVNAIHFDLMLRKGFLEESNYPGGRLHTYASVGPALFIPSPGDVTPGVRFGLGAEYRLTKNLGLFGEFSFMRFTHKESAGTGGSDCFLNVLNEIQCNGIAQQKVEQNLHTNFFLVGVTYHFDMAGR
jgi:hypothetical protein